MKHKSLYVAVSVGNGTRAQFSTPLSFLFSQISKIWCLQHKETMTKMYHSKNHWIWSNNKKVMAKFVLSATGQLRDIEKYTQFSNCWILLNFREKWFFLSQYCGQYCWECLELTMIHASHLDFFWDKFLQKMWRRQRDVGNGTCFLVPCFFIFNTFICF